MNHRKVLLFITIAYGLTWLILFGLEQVISNNDGFLGIFLTFLYRWGPAISALIVARRVYSDPLGHIGLTPRDQISTRWFFYGLGWVVVTMVGMLLLTGIFGNLAHVPMIGEVDFDSARILKQLTPEDMKPEEIPAWMGNMPGWVLLLLFSFTQLLLGTTLYVAYTYGEELGWRGFLMQETKSLGFWKGNLLTGLISGIWYLALVFQTLRQDDLQVADMVMTVVFYVSLAYPMSYFVRKSGSILTAACMAGVLLALTGTSQIFIVSDHMALNGLMGILGTVICWITTAIIAWKDPGFLTAFADRPYRIGDEIKNPD